MQDEMRFRLQAKDGRFAGYGAGAQTASLGDESTAYVFRSAMEAEVAALKFSKLLGVEIAAMEYPAVAGGFRVGDRVRFALPLSADEAMECYELLELRGDRALARLLNSGMRIEPTAVLALRDLQAVT